MMLHWSRAASMAADFLVSCRSMPRRELGRETTDRTALLPTFTINRKPSELSMRTCSRLPCCRSEEARLAKDSIDAEMALNLSGLTLLCSLDAIRMPSLLMTAAACMLAVPLTKSPSTLSIFCFCACMLWLISVNAGIRNQNFARSLSARNAASSLTTSERALMSSRASLSVVVVMNEMIWFLFFVALKKT